MIFKKLQERLISNKFFFKKKRFAPDFSTANWDMSTTN